MGNYDHSVRISIYLLTLLMFCGLIIYVSRFRSFIYFQSLLRENCQEMCCLRNIFSQFHLVAAVWTTYLPTRLRRLHFKLLFSFPKLTDEAKPKIIIILIIISVIYWVTIVKIFYFSLFSNKKQKKIEKIMKIKHHWILRNLTTIYRKRDRQTDRQTGQIVVHQPNIKPCLISNRYTRRDHTIV